MKKLLLSAILILHIAFLYSQNVGINATGGAPNASAGLDVDFNNRGVLIPRVALTATNAAGPITSPATSLLVYNTATAGTAPNNVTPGYYYWNGTAWVRLLNNDGNNGLSWLTTGNNGTTVANNFIGTIDNQSFAIRTNNTERMRILNTGLVGINTTAPVMMLDVTWNTTTANNAAIRGSVTAASASVYGVLGIAQSENGMGIFGFNSNASGTGVIGAGNNLAAQFLTGGSGGAFTSSNVGVFGYGNNTAASWGVYGQSINATGIGVVGVATVNTGTGMFAINSAANGTAAGFGLDARTNQTGGAAIIANLRASSFFSNSAISAFTDPNIAGGIGIIAEASNATSVAVQGQTSGAGASLAVAGINSGANVQATGVYGVATATTAGSGFTTNTCRKSVYGQGNSATGSYRFGIYGNGGVSIRTGGVIGHNNGATFFSAGALGYYASNGIDYAVYGFSGAYQAGVAGGYIHSNPYINGDLYASTEKINSFNKMINSFHDDDVMFHTWSDKSPNATIGLGIYGGVMGGWIKGLVYGTNLSGAKYGVYVHGKTITNNIITTLNDVGEKKRIATYAPSAMKVDVTERGKAKLDNGQARVQFSEEFSKMLSENEDITITVTPMGNCKGIYIENYSTKGFSVKELENGNSNVAFNWIAIGVKKGFENPRISAEILESDFEIKMNGPQGIMYNDNNPAEPIYSIWYDGKNVRFDKPNITKQVEKPLKNMVEKHEVKDNDKLRSIQIQSLEKIKE